MCDSRSADHFTVGVEQVVGLSLVQGELAHGDARAGVDVQLLAVLDDPAAGVELPVDGLPGLSCDLGEILFLRDGLCHLQDFHGVERLFQDV